jgi:hypothetical protein
MRVDDDNAERVQQEVRTAERKLQQQQQAKRTNEASAFDKTMTGQKAETLRQADTGQKPGEGRSTLQKAMQALKGETDTQAARQGLLGEAAQTEQGQAQKQHAQAKLAPPPQAQAKHQDKVTHQQGQARSGEQVQSDKQTQGQQGALRQEGQQLAGGLQQRVGQSQRQQDGQGEQRGQDGKSASRTEARRADETLSASQGRASAGVTADSKGKVGGAQGDQDKGQGGSGGKDPSKEASFRLPPAALMAPPPLARPKDVQPNSRLRQLAQEIADKIVKNVRVGTNKLGLPEFQLELKSDILKGLKVKVSGRHGRLRASFSSSDRDVLKQLRAEVGSLREQLVARGFKVDALDIEEERA